MLFVHFTPKKNLKRIKRTGLRPGKGETGVFLYPLLRGEKPVTNQWNRPFWWDPGTVRHDKQMAKVIVRLPGNAKIRWGSEGSSRIHEPITVREFGHWVAAVFPHRDDPSAWAKVWETYPHLGLCFYHAFWSWEVLYEGVIPRAWIVKILDRTNTDVRSRAYRREKAKRELFRS